MSMGIRETWGDMLLICFLSRGRFNCYEDTCRADQKSKKQECKEKFLYRSHYMEHNRRVFSSAMCQLAVVAAVSGITCFTFSAIHEDFSCGSDGLSGGAKFLCRISSSLVPISGIVTAVSLSILPFVFAISPQFIHDSFRRSCCGYP